jgi:hypothetical protein
VSHQHSSSSATSERLASVEAYNRRRAARLAAAPKPSPGLGDMMKGALSAIGITEERVSKAIGRPCGCGKRAEALNKLGHKLGIGSPGNTG